MKHFRSWNLPEKHFAAATANEAAVAAFLDERISFTGIMKLVEMTTERFSAPAPQSVEEIFAIDTEARARAAEMLSAPEFFN